MESNFEKFKSCLSNYVKNQPFTPELRMMGDGTIDVYYSPFDAINPRAKICIVGISPGKTQAENANLCASEWINGGASSSVILEKAKDTASFSGALRNNLIALLDYVGLSEHWGLKTASQLFSTDKHLLHSTSVFRYPVLVNGEPISSAQQGLKHVILKSMVDTYLTRECHSLSDDVVYIPLGKGTEDILVYLAKQGCIKLEQILTSFPHPSGANAERLAYFMGRKDKINLSSRTNSKKLDDIKLELFRQLESIGVETPTVKGINNSTSKLNQDEILPRINPTPTENKNILGSLTNNLLKSDLRSPNDGFMRDNVESQLRALLSEQGLLLNTVKSRKSKELAVTLGDVVIAYISRKTGLKDANLTVCLHPKYKEKMDNLVQQLDNVNIKVGRQSRYISSSNYQGFNSKGFSTEINSNEHIAIAYTVDVSNDYSMLNSFFSHYLEVSDLV